MEKVCYRVLILEISDTASASTAALAAAAAAAAVKAAEIDAACCDWLSSNASRSCVIG